MNLLTKNIGFISRFKNMDMQAIVQHAINFNMSYLALKVMDGQRSMNVLTDNHKNNILAKLIEHSKTNNLKMAVYVTIAGGDVQVEFNRLVNRILGFESGIHAIIIEVTDSWIIRKSEEAIKYVELLRNKYPNIPIVLFDNTTGSINMSTWASLVDQIMVIIDDSITNQYLKYWSYELWDKDFELDKKFVPVLGICNLPNHNYIFGRLKVKTIYDSIMTSKFNACGFFDWNPEGVPGLGDDGSGIDKTVESLKWTKTLTVFDNIPEVPIIEDPIIPQDPIIIPEFYTFTEERFNELYKWMKEEKLKG